MSKSKIKKPSIPREGTKARGVYDRRIARQKKEAQFKRDMKAIKRKREKYPNYKAQPLPSGRRSITISDSSKTKLLNHIKSLQAVNGGVSNVFNQQIIFEFDKQVASESSSQSDGDDENPNSYVSMSNMVFNNLAPRVEARVKQLEEKGLMPKKGARWHAIITFKV